MICTRHAVRHDAGRQAGGARDTNPFGAVRPARLPAFFIFAITSLLLLLWSTPAAALDCNPFVSPACYGGGDALAPDLAITPDGGSHTVASAGSIKPVPVKISFSDPDGLRRETLQIKLWSAGNSGVLQSGFTWSPNNDNTFALAQGTLQLRSAGDNILTAEIADTPGNVGSARATFHLSIENPNLKPVVSTEFHHDGYRQTSLGAMTLSYAMPGYISMDTVRSVGLFYSSQQANPTGFVQLDVDTGTIPDGSQANAVSLRIFEWLPGTDGNEAVGAPVTTEDVWVKLPSGRQRVGAQWSMRDKPTGAYKYWAEVRAYRGDRTLIASTRVVVRVLVLNESASRYGAGWSPAGVQRIYNTGDGKVEGIVLSEGNGIVRFFEKGACSGVECDYRTPAGDFSRIVYKTQPAPHWERTYSDGTVITFSSAGLMTSVGDRFGRSTRFDWVLAADDPRPPAPLLIRVTDHTGKVTSTEYYDGYLSAIIDPAGRRANLSYQNGTLAGIAGPTNLTATYDAAGRLVSYKDWVGSWNVTYGGAGTVYRVTGPTVKADGQDVRLTTTYRSLIGLTVLAGGETSVCCNWAAAVPSDAVWTSVTDPLGHPAYESLDRYGNVTKYWDPLGRSSVSVYNSNGLPVSTGNGTQQIVYDWDSRGHLLSRSVNGTVIYSASYVGDQLEYEVSGGEQTWYSYGSRGEVKSTWTGRKEDAYRTATTYEYDAGYFLIASNGPSGERTEWSYANPWQNLSEVRHVRADGVTLTQSFTFDEAGRTRTVKNPLQQTTTIGYDNLNRVRDVADLLQKTVRFGYTGPYLTSVTDQAGKVYGYVYNSLGWLTSEKFPEDNTTRSYAYNKDGQLLSVTDRRGQTVAMAYDSAHRLLTRTADGIATRFDYPDENTTVMTNNETQETIRRNPWIGGVELVKGTLGGPESTRHYEIQAVYEDFSWMTRGIDVRLYQNGSLVRSPESIRYTFDPRPVDTTLGSAISIQDLAGRTTTLGYDPSGRHIRTTFPNGVTQYNWYFKDGLQSGRTFSNSTLTQQLGANYGYDHLGRMTERTSASGDTLRAYEYDSQGQLREYRNQQRGTPPGCDPSQEPCDPIWLPGPYETYSYDAVGNRTDRAAELLPQSNRYRTFDGYTLEYDAEGNMKRKSRPGFEQTLTWNALGQLASVTTNGATVTYGYSPTGRRIRRTEGGQTRYSIYHNEDLLMELDGNFNPLHAYTHMPGIDLPLSVETGGDPNSVYYYTMEQPGHVSALLNGSGSIAARYQYAPFGRLESSTGMSSQSLKFMGREHDASTGLYYVRARWYDPALARFISSDPIGLAGGINTYAYVGNAPMDARDPSGLQAQEPNPLPQSCPTGTCRLEPVTVEGCTNPFIPGCQQAPGFFESPSLKSFGGLRLADQLGQSFINDSTGQRAQMDAARRQAREEANRRRSDAGEANNNRPSGETSEEQDEMDCQTALSLLVLSGVTDVLFWSGGVALKPSLTAATMTMRQGIAKGTLLRGSERGVSVWRVARATARRQAAAAGTRLVGGVAVKVATNGVRRENLWGAVPFIGTAFIHAPAAWKACGLN
jgi:RHS repeat-associated protein